MRPVFLGIVTLAVSACEVDLAPASREPTSYVSAAMASEPHAGVALTLITHVDARSFTLSRAIIDLSGPASVTLRAPRDVDHDMLSTPLPAGSYATFLRPGFSVEEQLPDGTKRSVNAQLVSENPRIVHLSGSNFEPLAFSFVIDGQPVVIGGPRDLRLSDRR